jgi:hypothetical protein
MNCVMCASPLRSTNRSGYCGAHRKLDPAYGEKQRAYERTRYPNPRRPAMYPPHASRAVEPDDVMIDRIVHHGRADGATRKERRAAAVRVRRSHPDWSAARIAAHVGFSSRTIERMIRGAR